jgi:hypothetical protein
MCPVCFSSPERRKPSIDGMKPGISFQCVSYLLDEEIDGGMETGSGPAPATIRFRVRHLLAERERSYIADRCDERVYRCVRALCDRSINMFKLSFPTVILT